MQKLYVFVDDGENRSLTQGELICGESGRVHIRTHVCEAVFELEFTDIQSRQALTVKRRGGTSYDMPFEKNKETSAEISTPYGKTDLDYKTHSLHCDCDKSIHRYEFKIHYTVCGSQDRHLTVIAAKSKEDL